MIDKFDNFVFDLDGTLVDSAPRILSCLSSTLAAHGFTIPIGTINTKLIGPPVNAMISKLIRSDDNELVQILVEDFRKRYSAEPNRDTEAYVGGKEFLMSLKTKGKNIYVATNKPFILARRVVDNFYPGIFKKIYTQDLKKKGFQDKFEMIKDLITENSLDRKKTILFGDTEGDFYAAKGNRISFAFIKFGYGENKSILADKSDYVVKSYVGLMQVDRSNKD